MNSEAVTAAVFFSRSIESAPNASVAATHIHAKASPMRVWARAEWKVGNDRRRARGRILLGGDDAKARCLLERKSPLASSNREERGGAGIRGAPATRQSIFALTPT